MTDTTRNMAKIAGVLQQIRDQNPRARKKSKRGCSTCKMRKIKCDESLPVCNNCERYFQSGAPICEYGTDPPSRKASRDGCASSNETPRAASQYISLRSKPPGRRFQRKYTSTPKPLGTQVLDPFDASEITKLPAAEELLYHHLAGIRNTCIPAGFKAETNPMPLGWWALVRTDPFLRHVMLHVAAVDLEWASGKPNTYSSEQYRSQSHHLLRAKLEDPVSGVSDETVAGVVTLAVVEHGMGNMMAMKMHMDGLKRIIKLRGGLDNIRKSNPTAATVAAWFSLQITTESLLTFDDLNALEEHFNFDFDQNYIQLEDLVDDPRILKVLIEVRQYLHDFDRSAKDNSLLLSGNQSIHEANSWLLQRLLHKPPPRTCYDPMSDSCRFAAALFLSFPWSKHFPDPVLLRNSLIHRLKDAVSGALPCSIPEKNLVLWILATGGVASKNLPQERAWFVNHLIGIATDMKVSSYETFKSYLEKVMWLNAMNDTPFRELWEETKKRAESQISNFPFRWVLSERTLNKELGENL